MNLKHHVSMFDRFSWAIRLVGAAYLVLFTSWFTNDADLIIESAPNGIFSAQAHSLSSIIQSGCLIFGFAASITLIATKLIRFPLIICLTSLIILLGQLPSELLQSADRFLMALSLLLIITPSQRDPKSTMIRVYAMSGLVALWAWTNLYFIYQSPSPIWTRLHFFNFWAWTDAAPTPFALILASSPFWLKKSVGMMLILSLAFAPIVTLLKNRLWPLVWLSFILLFSFGEGLPSWLTLLMLLGLLIASDQRWPNGIDHKLQQYIPLHYFSTLALLRWPVLILSAWLCLSNHLGITPLLIICVYLICSSGHVPATKIDGEPSHLGLGKTIKSLFPVLLAIIFLSLNILGYNSEIRTHLPQLNPWLLTQADAQWTIAPKERSSLILERSEDGGASWLKEEHIALDRLTMQNQPWRPFHPLREEGWFHQVAQSSECIEGPFMELFERRLKFHIRRLNTPPLKTAGQHILLRARRVHWVRSRYQFWREEAKGFFCIATNLPVLLKARAMVQQSRDKLPQMPTLDPSHKPK
ncbi:MAG: hypothetical protein CMH49_02460 [Myxococcales bacterium]|nr:hypothetical protein [Myxococcales bacterium]